MLATNIERPRFSLPFQTDEFHRINMRVAVIQLTTHPAITIEATDYMAEPFLDKGKEPPILGSLLRRETAGEVQALRDDIRQMYLGWATNRLRGVIKWLETVSPDIVVFPEFSVPYEHLVMLRNFSHNQRCIVIAANHAFNRRAEDYRQTLGWFPEEKGRQMPPWWISSGACSLLVAFSPPLDKGIGGYEKFDAEAKHGIYYRFKLKLSPQEFSAFHVEKNPAPKGSSRFPLNPRRHRYSDKRARFEERSKRKWMSEQNRLFKFLLPDGNPAITIDVMICAEAFQGVACSNEAEMLAICAYHDKPREYDHILYQTARRQKIAVLASDGAFGESIINLNYDSTVPSWWLNGEGNGRLPTGDGILVCEIPTRYTVASRGATNPFKEHALLNLAAITSSNKFDEHFKVADQVGSLFDSRAKVARIITSTLQEQATLGQDIRNILKRRKPSQLQLIKYGHLAELANLGQLSKISIDALARDCVFEGSKEK